MALSIQPARACPRFAAKLPSLMTRDGFENELSSQPWREPPGEWKEEILRQTGETSRPRIEAVRFRDVSRWHELLWPHPAAWAGLAAVWMAVLAFHWTAPDAHRAPPMDFSDAPANATPGLEMALIEQRMLKNELLGMTDNNDEKPTTGKPREPAESRPRSDVVADWAAT